MINHKTCPFAPVIAAIMLAGVASLMAQTIDTLYVGHALLRGRELPSGTHIFHSYKIESSTRKPLNTTV